MNLLIHSVWITRKGVCLLNLTCDCMDVDHQLFSGFLTAISSFTKETVKREVNTIFIEDLKFVFEKNSDFFFVLCAEKNDNNMLLHKKLIRIQAHFFHKYKDILSDWKGEISKFAPFGEKIDKIINCSIEGTVLYCENCEHIIPDENHMKRIERHDFYFCCENCQDHFADLCMEFLGDTKHFEFI